jgi:hypothetical protein
MSRLYVETGERVEPSPLLGRQTETFGQGPDRRDRGVFKRSLSRLRIVRTLTPARSANSSWVSCACHRNPRNIAPNVWLPLLHPTRATTSATPTGDGEDQ